MKWITRERARVDRIACPWLIRRFIDPRPEFLFVPAGQVMAVATREGAIPYDVPNVELGHQGPQCSFDAFIARYELNDAALTRLAVIVRGADTDDRRLTPESAGLYAAATGFQAISRDDADNMAHQFPLYDALYAFARLETPEVPPRSRVPPASPAGLQPADAGWRRPAGSPSTRWPRARSPMESWRRER